MNLTALHEQSGLQVYLTISDKPLYDPSPRHVDIKANSYMSNMQRQCHLHYLN